MSRQEDFNNQTDKYANERKSFGVSDPYALKEIEEAHYQGIEYGYQYAVEKTVEFLKEKEFGDWIEQEATSFIEDFRKAMQ